MSPFAAWREFSMRQLVAFYNIVCRSQWYDKQFAAAIHGAEMSKEPEWYFGYSRSSSIEDEMTELQAYIARKKASHG